MPLAWAILLDVDAVTEAVHIVASITEAQVMIRTNANALSYCYCRNLEASVWGIGIPSVGLGYQDCRARDGPLQPLKPCEQSSSKF